MGNTKENKVRMIGPKGKKATVSLAASRSKHLANLGFVREDSVMPLTDDPFAEQEARLARGAAALKEDRDRLLAEASRLEEERAAFEREKEEHAAAMMAHDQTTGAESENNKNTTTDGHQA